ncbi:MAG: hypothetical protein R2822_10945 [Spirosomataceae bacterium]
MPYRLLLQDYEANAYEGEYYNDYYLRQATNIFMPTQTLADLTTVVDSDLSIGIMTVI